MLNQLKKEFVKLANPDQARLLQSFFKTAPGQYGHGDIFLGIKVPDQRKLAKTYPNLILKDLQELISSKIHEHRLTSLFILINQYKKSKNKKPFVNFYLKNLKYIGLVIYNNK